MPANSFAVVPGAAAQYMVGMIPYPFRQDADFRYLTGLLQKNLVAVFESACRGTSWHACNTRNVMNSSHMLQCLQAEMHATCCLPSSV